MWLPYSLIDHWTREHFSPRNLIKNSVGRMKDTRAKMTTMSIHIVRVIISCFVNK